MNEEQFDETYQNSLLPTVVESLANFRDTGKLYLRGAQENAQRKGARDVHRRAELNGIISDLEKIMDSGITTFSQFKEKDNAYYGLLRRMLVRFISEYGWNF